MRTKFNTGHWSIETNSISQISVATVIKTDNKTGIDCPVICDMWGQSTEEGKANARLIKAAPLLYCIVEDIKESLIFDLLTDEQKENIENVLATVLIDMKMLEDITLTPGDIVAVDKGGYTNIYIYKKVNSNLLYYYGGLEYGVLLSCESYIPVNNIRKATVDEISKLFVTIVDSGFYFDFNSMEIKPLK